MIIYRLEDKNGEGHIFIKMAQLVFDKDFMLYEIEVESVIMKSMAGQIVFDEKDVLRKR